MENILITIDDLLGNARELDKPKDDRFKVKLKKLNKEIEMRKLSFSEWTDILETSNEDKDAEVIYTVCSMLHDDTLITRLKCKNNPIDVVRKVFDRKTVYHLAQYILEISDLAFGKSEDYLEKVESDIKN